MVSRKLVRPRIELLESYGVQDITVRQANSGHVRYSGSWRGQPVDFTSSLTPGDRKVMLLWAKDVRRILRTIAERLPPTTPSTGEHHHG